MRKLGLGLGLSRGGRGGTPPIITATLTPAMSTIYAGQAVDDVTNWASFIDTANYASTAGTIVSAVPAFTGDAAAADDPLADGETAGFTITVTDSEANERVFTAGQIAITYAPPVAAGGITDQSYPQDTAISTLDVSADFTGSGITYALAPSSAALPAGLSLSGAGAITGTPTAEAAEVIIVVRGTNSGGYDDTAFGITISEPAASLSGLDTATDAGVSFEVETDIGTAVYWLVDQNATRTYAQTAAGGGQDSGNEFIPAGVNTIFYDMTGALGGTWYVHVVRSGGGDGDVLSGSFTYQSAPAQFGTGDWSVVDEESGGTVTVTVSSMPANGGSAITDIEYQVDGGSWTSSSTSTAGTFDVTGLTDDVEVDIAIRAVNAIGNGMASATKAVTPTTAVTFDVAYVGYTDAGTSDGTSGPYTFTAHSIGAADANRKVVVAINNQPDNTTSVTGVTIGGVTATQIGANQGTTNAEISFWYAAVPTGTTADIVVSFDGNFNDLSVGVWRVINGVFGTPTQVATTGTATCTLSLNVAAGDYVIAASFCANGGTEGNSTWVGATKNYDDDIRTFEIATGATAGPVSAATPRTVTMTSSSSALSMVGISFAVSEAA